jgi:hypothetical protein
MTKSRANLVLKPLSEQFARRAREFSDTVALLGHHDHIGPGVLKLFQEIKHQHALCTDAEGKLEQYLQDGNKQTKMSIRSLGQHQHGNNGIPVEAADSDGSS